MNQRSAYDKSMMAVFNGPNGATSPIGVGNLSWSTNGGSVENYHPISIGKPTYQAYQPYVVLPGSRMSNCWSFKRSPYDKMMLKQCQRNQ